MSNPAVLIVDDEVLYCKVLREFLSSLDLTVYVANDAQGALLELDHHGVDLILLDVMMPYCDGLTLAEKLRMDPSRSKIPIVIISALAMTEDRKRAMQAGVDAYLVKPFSSKELTEVLRQYILI